MVGSDVANSREMEVCAKSGVQIAVSGVRRRPEDLHCRRVASGGGGDGHAPVMVQVGTAVIAYPEKTTLIGKPKRGEHE